MYVIGEELNTKGRVNKKTDGFLKSMMVTLMVMHVFFEK
jgi:hypothetical protein